MLRANKYRLYPTDSQKELLNKHFGCVRLVYNLALRVKSEAYSTHKINISTYELINQIPDLKEGFPFLKEVYSSSLQASCLNMEKAYDNFFKHGAKFPNFKKKSSRQSFQIPCQTKVDFDLSKTYLPKFREGIKTVFDRTFKGTIKTVTVSKTPTGKYFVSILVDTGIRQPEKAQVNKSTAIGIDLGIKSFLVTSEGVKVDNPKYLYNSATRLAVLQRRAARKIKGSQNRKKANRSVAVLHEKITNQRKDFLHKLSSTLISENQTICIENLNISGMTKNHKLARSITDCGWSEFVSMLKYKSDWYGKNVLQIGRFEPSSKMCNTCNAINYNLTLTDRQWTCAVCGTHHDRDINAAKNIKAIAFKTPKGIGAEPVEMSALAESVKQEYLEIGIPINE